MSEDTSVNTGVGWPDPVSAAGLLVRRMQVKLHRWAGADRSRRFADLFNLVYDPAFLTARVAAGQTNAGCADARGRSGHRGLDRRPGRSARRSWTTSGSS